MSGSLFRYASIPCGIELSTDSSQRMEQETVDPEHGTWMIGANGIQLQHLHLGALEQVSAGSWQPRLFYKE